MKEFVLENTQEIKDFRVMELVLEHVIKEFLDDYRSGL